MNQILNFIRKIPKFVWVLAAIYAAWSIAYPSGT